MALQESLDVLVRFGVFNEQAVDRLASMVQAVESLTGGATAVASVGAKKRGRPAGSGKIAGGEPAKRGRRSSFEITKEELKKMYVDEGMTAKEIAEKYGVAPVTVAQRAMKLGISKRAKKGKK
jgi:hypothetical protein